MARVHLFVTYISNLKIKTLACIKAVGYLFFPPFNVHQCNMHYSINKKHKYITVGSKVHKTDAVQMKGNHNANQGLIVFNEPVMQEANTNNDTPVVVDISTTGLWQPHLVCCDINVIHHITKNNRNMWPHP